MIKFGLIVDPRGRRPWPRPAWMALAVLTLGLALARGAQGPTTPEVVSLSLGVVLLAGMGAGGLCLLAVAAARAAWRARP